MTDDHPTDPRAAPMPHIEGGDAQLVSILRNVVEEAVRPLRHDIASVAANTDLAREAMRGLRDSLEARVADLERWRREVEARERQE